MFLAPSWAFKQQEIFQWRVQNPVRTDEQTENLLLQEPQYDALDLIRNKVTSLKGQREQRISQMLKALPFTHITQTTAAEWPEVSKGTECKLGTLQGGRVVGASTSKPMGGGRSWPS